MNLETITNILVENAEQLRRGNSLDMSMFPEAEIPRIYAAAAEGTLRKRDFDSTGHYLFLGKQWGRLLELGVPFFHSRDESEQKAGMHFLEILMGHDKLPEDVAIELADHLLKQEHSSYTAATALAAGNATKRAGEIADVFFNEGNLEEGMRFFKVTGKKLANDEVTRFAGIALERGRYKDVFELYESQSLSLPKDRAKIIASCDAGGWMFDRVVKYLDKTKKPFSPEEFKELADATFKAGNHDKALEIYERAGKSVSPEDYLNRGEQILDRVKEIESSRSSWSSVDVWPSISAAYAYLSKGRPKEAKQRIAKYADALLDQPDFANMSSNAEEFGKIYTMLNMPLPIDKALKAARLSEEKEKYGEAAKFYAAAGMNDVAKRMGNLALRSDNDWQRKYGSQNAFNAAGDKDGLAVAQFIEKNLRRY
ncbi:MAG: hypothetical protein AABY26_00660 [Nanoarchaeota archaeon]